MNWGIKEEFRLKGLQAVSSPAPAQGLRSDQASRDFILPGLQSSPGSPRPGCVTSCPPRALSPAVGLAEGQPFPVKACEDLFPRFIILHSRKLQSSILGGGKKKRKEKRKIMFCFLWMTVRDLSLHPASAGVKPAFQWQMKKAAQLQPCQDSSVSSTFSPAAVWGFLNMTVIVTSKSSYFWTSALANIGSFCVLIHVFLWRTGAL